MLVQACLVVCGSQVSGGKVSDPFSRIDPAQLAKIKSIKALRIQEHHQVYTVTSAKASSIKTQATFSSKILEYRLRDAQHTVRQVRSKESNLVIFVPLGQLFHRCSQCC